MILVVTEPSDRTANQVIAKLKARGADVARFDPADFPSRASMSVALDARGGQTVTLTQAGERIALHELGALWYRRPHAPVPHAEVDEAHRGYLEAECAHWMWDIWNLLPCRIVPATPSVIARADLKAAQLAIAGAVGFELPPTLVSNDPDEFLDFYRRHQGRVISKAPSTLFNNHFGGALARYTEPVDRFELGHAQSIRFGPVIFQAYVPKRIELRITIVGRRVFAAEIHSQQSQRARHDWRHYDLANTPHARHCLPAEIEQCCLLLVQRLGLCYGAIDMIVTPEGRYVFLEINPNGQYQWIEHLTGLPISEAMCDLLMAHEPRHPLPSPAPADCMGACA
ncbi:ATP-dependent carboxylate-amine ligase [Albitalea terrae]|uniref:ATP-dependent carboxylate-amine ligase n=1 Tax=Piscinibacter terrae TaxID=2496871 RepID=A0A3N7HVU9_9BURK|nr:ATP-dependent carboxylate-amine ligase [Albitalea terrae]